MAAWTDLVETRLRIKDPLGIIALATVADDAARTALTPARQTAYKQLDTGTYWTFDEGTGAWKAVDLLISDERLGLLIDVHGAARAAPKAIKDITAELGQRLYTSRIQDGAGTVEFQNLTTMRNFYKDLAAAMDEDVSKEEGKSQGGYFRTAKPDIGGGMLG